MIAPSSTRRVTQPDHSRCQGESDCAFEARRASRLTTTIQERVELKRAQAVLIAHCCLSGSAVDNAEKDGSTSTHQLMRLAHRTSVLAGSQCDCAWSLLCQALPQGDQCPFRAERQGRATTFSIVETGLNYERVQALINFNGNHGQGT